MIRTVGGMKAGRRKPSMLTVGPDVIGTQDVLEARKRGHGQERRIFVIVLVVVLSEIGVIGIATISRNASATTTVSGYNGWDGNGVIYMTEGIDNAHPPVIQGTFNTTSQPGSGNPYNIANALNVSVGQAHNTTNTYWMFTEYYHGGGSNPYLQVYAPIIATGGTQQVYDASSNPPTWDQVIDQQVSLSISDSPSTNTYLQIQGGFDSGVNTTGKIPEGTNTSLEQFNFWYDAASQLPKLGYAMGSWSIMNGANKASAVDQYDGSAGANGQVLQTFGVKGGNVNTGLPGTQRGQDAFGPQQVVYANIPESEWISNRPVLTITATNIVGDLYYCYGCSPVNGASASITVSAVPAVTLTGTVTLGTRPLKNCPITLQETYNGVTTNYQLTTNSTGAYRFFARLGTSYTLLATYGSTAWQNGPFTTASTATSQTEDLNIPALSVTAGANPNPTYPPANVTFWTSLWGGYISPVTYAWTFGDGTTGTGQDPYHVYTSSGTFHVNVTVTDSSSPVQTAKDTFPMVVNNPCSGTSACISPPSQTVYYGICASPTASFEGFPATTDGGPFTYSWNFGDGTTGGNYQIISHTYPYVQTTYTVTLTITDGTGVKSMATATVTVKNMGKICAPS